MPQTTNLNTPPYFEDFDPNDNFHKVLFRPGFPLQARELTTLQSTLQDQIEKFGSSIYKDGAMVIPGQIGYDLYYTSVLIEEEYFGIQSDLLVDYIVGQTIIGNTSGVKARVVNVLSSEQSEKGKTTLYVKYISAGSNNQSATFLDDEIIITQNSFSIGNTVIQENTDFAKCVSLDANNVGSAAKITPGVYFIKGFFVTVQEQEIILDQFGTTPSYRVGLQVLEEIVTPEDNAELTDPSQGYSNYAAPGAHRLKLNAVLIKKSLTDTTALDFIELLKLEEGRVQEIVNSSKAQIARTLEDTLARRTYDESGDYEVVPYTFSKDECLNDGTNNGIFEVRTETDFGNTPSSDLFEVNVSPGKSYVRGYELETLTTTYVDIEKPRTFESVNNRAFDTDARSVEFRCANTYSPIVTNLNAALSTNKIVILRSSTDPAGSARGYAIFKSYEEKTDYHLLRVSNIKFISTTTNIESIDTLVINPTITWTSDTYVDGESFTVTSTVGTPKVYLFPVYGSNVIKSVTDETVGTVLSYATGDVGTSNAVEITNRYFNSSEASAYTIRVSDDLNGTKRTITIDELDIGTGLLRFTISGDDAKDQTYTLIGPEYIGNPNVKLTSLKKMRVVKLSDIADRYDLNSNSISLGATRVNKIHAIYNLPTGTAAGDVYPKFTVAAGAQPFKIGEVFVGRSSGSKGRLIKQDNNTFYFVYETTSNFINNEEIFGFETGSTATINELQNNGVANIKNRYILDDGQRSQTFEYSSLRKSAADSVIPPSTDLWVVFDYFKDQNLSGQYYSVNSYYDAKIEEIPSFTVGEVNYYLNDCIDWRVNQEEVYTSGTTGEFNSPFTIDSAEIIVGTTLESYGNTNYINTGNYILPAGISTADVEYYLGRIDELYLDKNGNFISKKGIPSLDRKRPSDTLNNSMKLLTIDMPPYVRDLSEVTFSRHTNKRYTMRDIGNLEKRIDNVEYYTQLSLLETDTVNLFIPDGNNNNRLKNGFLVDNFTSHSIGDPSHPNYKCSMDMGEGELRPQHYTTNIRLNYQQEPTNYVKGDLLMLDYDHQLLVEQPYAAVVENVNPFAVVSWVGLMQIFPATDDWVDEERLPETLTSVEGDYAATVFQLGVDRNTGFAPIEWGAWQTQWSSTSSSSSTRIENSGGGPPIRRVTTSSSSTTTFQTRSGIRTRVTPRVDRQVLGDRVVDIKYAWWKRSRNISITSFRLKPGIRVYPFFDGREVTAYVTPKIIEIQMTGSAKFTIDEDIVVTGNVGRKFRAKLAAPQAGIENLDKPYSINPYTGLEITSNNYNSTSNFLNLDISSMQELNASEYGGYLLEEDTIVGLSSGATAKVTGKKLIADDKGNLRASFYIPDPNDDGNPRWKVGESILRLTDSPVNSLIPGEVDSSAEGAYSARGTTFTKQQDTLLVRNAEITRDTVSDSRTLSSSSSSTRAGGWFDPLAQSFLIEEAGGCFITKIEVYFRTKDTSLPITMQIREMVNGYPSPVVLGTINKDPADVFLSEDASVPTVFEFKTPVYLPERQEFCFALLTSSVEYKVWLSEMGKDDLNGERISKQPYAGVLFKSQNASTWTTAELQDFKFKIYRAKFKLDQLPTITFVNDNDGNSQYTRLRRDPIELNVNSGRIKVYHKNHGMHDNSAQVEIKGVSTEQYASLSDDWLGGNNTPITLIGNRNYFAYNGYINGQPASSTNLGYFKIGDCVYSYDPTAVGQLNGDNQYEITAIQKISGNVPAAGFKVSDGWQVENYVYDGVPLTFINAIHSQLEWITLDSYQINLGSVVRGTTETPNTENLTFGGDYVYASRDITYHSLLPLFGARELPGTTIEASVKLTSGTSLGDSSYSDPASTSIPSQASYIRDADFTPVVLNENNDFYRVSTIASKLNEEKQMLGSKSLELQIKMFSEVDNLSPVIDRDRISLVTTANRVSNFDGNFQTEYFFNNNTTYDIGASSTQDFNPANYITKLVSLANECTALRIEFAAFNPRSVCDIDVYVKLLSGDESNPNDVNWTEITSPTYENTRNELFFSDYKYETELTSGTFTKYQIKIRMRSSDQSLVPIIKDLRCIALA